MPEADKKTLTGIDKIALEQMPKGWFHPDMPYLGQGWTRWQCERLEALGCLESRVVGESPHFRTEYRKSGNKPVTRQGGAKPGACPGCHEADYLYKGKCYNPKCPERATLLLRACPFCKTLPESEPVVHQVLGERGYRGRVSCEKCGAIGPDTCRKGVYASKDMAYVAAVLAWNGEYDNWHR